MALFSLLMTLLLTGTMILFGLLFLKKPPRESNAVYGYRTRMSSLNEETWAFAHHYAGDVWFRTGVLSLTGSVAFILLLRNSVQFEKYVMFLFYFQMALMLLVIPLTEKALRKRFDKEGNRV